MPREEPGEAPVPETSGQTANLPVAKKSPRPSGTTSRLARPAATQATPSTGRSPRSEPYPLATGGTLQQAQQLEELPAPVRRRKGIQQVSDTPVEITPAEPTPVDEPPSVTEPSDRRRVLPERATPNRQPVPEITPEPALDSFDSQPSLSSPLATEPAIEAAQPDVIESETVEPPVAARPRTFARPVSQPLPVVQPRRTETPLPAVGEPVTTETVTPPLGVQASPLAELPQIGDVPEVLANDESMDLDGLPPVLANPSPDADANGNPLLPNPEPWIDYNEDAPLGYTGPSGIMPREAQSSAHFMPIEDRWRLGFPEWDRDGEGDPVGKDATYELGSKWDPYNQNVLKGDYPIIGQHTFLNVTAQQFSVFEQRAIPVATTPFESTRDPFQEENFGNPNQFFTTNYSRLQFDLFHGNAAFKPVDWQIRVAPVFNVNYLAARELAVVSPDVRDGKDRLRSWFALEEYFVETKLADISPHYDFISLRTGSQPFISDFRGFIFADTNRMVRLFGNNNANRDQFNIVVVKQTEKDTNSQLNTFDNRHQETVIANVYRQDFIFPGYTASASYHFNRDGPSFKFDKNDFLVRPEPVGVFRPHRVDSHYLGFAGDGHWGRYNISNAYYYAFGHDYRNPLAGREVDISAHMAAIELSYDRDYVRFRTSYFYASGDNNPTDDHGGGFDTIFDNPVFAGGSSTYWIRNQIPIFGTSLTNRQSLVADLRTSKFQGQTNFVNPGLQLANVGFDVDITPKTRFVHNTNFLWFDTTQTLEQFLFQAPIHRRIGTDLSGAIEYRPYLNNNVIFNFGANGLMPGSGFRDIYDKLGGTTHPKYSVFTEMTLQF